MITDFMNVAILGLGPSIKLFSGGIPSIGVNDIYRYYPADFVVCLDEKNRFTPERLDIIERSNPDMFFSQLDCWNTHQAFSRIKLQNDYPNYVCQLDLNDLPKSLCSPFVAVAIGFKMGFKNIHLFGVDLINHPTLKDRQTEKIKQHFKALKIALNQYDRNLIIHGDGILKSLNSL